MSFKILVDDTDSGQRFDSLVAARIPECSRSLAAGLIRKGTIRINGKIKKPGYRLRPADQISGKIPQPEAVSFVPEPIFLNILYEDSHIILINKSANFVVHPAPGHYSGTIVNALLHHCPDLKGIGGEIRPGIVHRLDKDTTGLLLIAKSGPALANLAHQFKVRTVQKRYLALVHGAVKEHFGQIIFPIGRHPTDRKKMSIASRNPKPAETLWKIRQTLPETSLLEVDLKTGRTHQIRVHFTAIHHPLVGDSVYCSPKQAKNHSKLVCQSIAPANRQMLHAWQMSFHHPQTGKMMKFEAPMPEDMRQILENLNRICKV